MSTLAHQVLQRTAINVHERMDVERPRIVAAMSEEEHFRFTTQRQLPPQDDVEMQNLEPSTEKALGEDQSSGAETMDLDDFGGWGNGDSWDEDSMEVDDTDVDMGFRDSGIAMLESDDSQVRSRFSSDEDDSLELPDASPVKPSTATRSVEMRDASPVKDSIKVFTWPTFPAASQMPPVSPRSIEMPDASPVKAPLQAFTWRPFTAASQMPEASPVKASSSTFQHLPSTLGPATPTRRSTVGPSASYHSDDDDDDYPSPDRDSTHGTPRSPPLVPYLRFDGTTTPPRRPELTFDAPRKPAYVRDISPDSPGSPSSGRMLAVDVPRTPPPRPELTFGAPRKPAPTLESISSTPGSPSSKLKLTSDALMNPHPGRELAFNAPFPTPPPKPGTGLTTNAPKKPPTAESIKRSTLEAEPVIRRLRFNAEMLMQFEDVYDEVGKMIGKFCFARPKAPGPSGPVEVKKSRGRKGKSLLRNEVTIEDLEALGTERIRGLRWAKDPSWKTESSWGKEPKKGW